MVQWIAGGKRKMVVVSGSIGQVAIGNWQWGGGARRRKTGGVGINGWLERGRDGLRR